MSPLPSLLHQPSAHGQPHQLGVGQDEQPDPPAIKLLPDRLDGDAGGDQGVSGFESGIGGVGHARHRLRLTVAHVFLPSSHAYQASRPFSTLCAIGLPSSSIRPAWS